MGTQDQLGAARMFTVRFYHETKDFFKKLQTAALIVIIVHTCVRACLVYTPVSHVSGHHPLKLKTLEGW